jgi:isoquinoline 1-oxidoreductase beta subunit
MSAVMIDTSAADLIAEFEKAMTAEAVADAAGGSLLAPLSGPFSRRGFMKVAGGVGGGLMLALVVGSDAEAQQAAGAARPAGPPPGPAFNPGAYVRVAPDGKITLYSKNPEIGQGIKTAFGLILAEELDAKWSDVTIEQSAIDAAVYGAQFAGGSLSIPMNWMILRQAGAGARAMLVAAAAKQWGVPASEVTTGDSMARHLPTNRSASYGSLATAAAGMPVPTPSSLKLKDKKDWKLLGKRHTGVDNLQLVKGEPLFGIDVQLPGMLVAVFEKCPAVGGKVASANLDEVKKLPGVVDAFVVEGTGKPTEVMPGVAILAKNTWSAFSARKALKVTWDESGASKDSWKRYVTQAKELGRKAEGAAVVKTVGNVDEALAKGKTVEAFYQFAFVSHAQLEPQNCTAWYKKDPSGDSLEVWAPSQTPGGAQTLVANVVGLPANRVTIRQMRIGGGFGRRLMNDYVAEVAQISKQAGGVPVKLRWQREDDMQHDFYRPGGFMAFKGALDEQGKLAAWNSHMISFTGDGKTPVTAGGWGANEFPAQYTANYRASQTLLPLQIPTGPWRAPGSNTAGWVVQSFMHELSTAAKRDHAEFLLEVFGNRQAAPAAGGEGAPPGLPPQAGLVPARAVGVIKAAVEKSGWGTRKLDKGHALGLAFHFSHQGHFAEVAEVSVDAKKKITVHKMWVVGDIGPIVNLSSAENQCQGCIVDAISTMGLEVTMENGRIEQKNFDRYPIARMPVSPVVEVTFIESEYSPTGVGEPAFPPAAPAICNAIYAATGKRIRTLPISKEGFSI